MFYREDWIIKQIETLIAALIDAVFKNKSSEKTYVQEQNTIDELIEKNKICEAENFIFERAKLEGTVNDSEFLLTVLHFYQRLNNMSEEDLNAAGFSHDEIKEGLIDFFSKYCGDEKIKGIIENAYLDEVIATSTQANEKDDDSV